MTSPCYFTFPTSWSNCHMRANRALLKRVCVSSPPPRVVLGGARRDRDLLDPPVFLFSDHDFRKWMICGRWNTTVERCSAIRAVADSSYALLNSFLIQGYNSKDLVLNVLFTRALISLWEYTSASLRLEEPWYGGYKFRILCHIILTESSLCLNSSWILSAHFAT